MTSLAAKLSVDTRGACALYILTDSRITWADSPETHWDAGQKAFNSHVSADIFGFCGDAFFPPAALRQMIDVINSGSLFSNDDSAECRHDRAMSVFRSAIENGRNLTVNDFSVIHGARDGELMSSRFRIWVVQYSSSTRCWQEEELVLDTSHSQFSYLGGSGRRSIEKFSKMWKGTSAEGTSRAAFGAFCKAVDSEYDIHSGGPPQLVGIFWKGRCSPIRNYMAWKEVSIRCGDPE